MLEVGAEGGPLRPRGLVSAIPQDGLCGPCRQYRARFQRHCRVSAILGPPVRGTCPLLQKKGCRPSLRSAPRLDRLTGAITYRLVTCTHSGLERGEVRIREAAAVPGPRAIELLVVQVARASGGTVGVAGLKADVARSAVARRLGISHVVNLGAEELDVGTAPAHANATSAP